MLNQFVYWGPLSLYLLFIFYLSAQPQLPSFIPLWWDKLLHFIGYSALGFLLARARSFGSFKESFTVLFLWASIGSFAYGVFDEIHQFFTPGREFSGLDMLADFFGGVAGFVCFLGYRYVIQKCGGTKIY